MVSRRRLLAAIGATALAGCALFDVPFPPEREAAIDAKVATFPQEHHRGYLLVKINCQTCHTLGRVFPVEPDPKADWKAIVVRMSAPAKAGIPKEDVAPMGDFLEFFYAELENGRK